MSNENPKPSGKGENIVSTSNPPLTHSQNKPLRWLLVPAVKGEQGYRLAFLLDDKEDFILLGEGRTAKVYLGMIVPNGVENDTLAANQNAEYLAIKCLLTDENDEYRQQIYARFKVEMEETANRGGGEQAEFVEFSCLGRISLVGLTKAEEAEPTVALLRKIALELRIDPWPDSVLEKVLKLDGEKLQGSFYAMQLCQGSLLDILESGDSWDELACYKALSWAQTNLRKVQGINNSDIQTITERFLDVLPETWSGYEILNSFKDDEEANRFRNLIVLELALTVANMVRNLHNSSVGLPLSLAHRDLKPGNILVRHPLSATGSFKPDFLLSDLGYVVDRRVLESGNPSIRLDSWRTHQVPGSQYYRAPEQWTLPIEVRMKVDQAHSGKGTVFQVLSSRLDSVEQGDYLAIPRKHFDLDDGRLKTIVEVTRSGGSGGPRRQRRQFRLRIDEKIKADIRHDIVAHIVKASGFHTDGFSFGATLYDLATGGKNPEHFYFYCLHRYQVDWDDKSQLTVEQIVDELLRLDEVEYEATEEVKKDGPTGWSQRMIKKFSKGDEPKEIPAPASIVVQTKEPTYAEYLHDERGVKMPREILLLICKCMLRGYKGCYYLPNLSGGWTSDENVNAFDRIINDINKVITPGKPKEGEPAVKGYDMPTGIPKPFRANTLVLLRCLGRGAILPTLAPRELPVEPKAETIRAVLAPAEKEGASSPSRDASSESE